jgi:hypothetical protein
MSITGKLYIVVFGGHDYLVRALTQRGAAKGLVQSLVDSAQAGTRLASQDDIFEMAGRGMKPVDVTSGDKDDTGDEAASQPPAGRA